MATDLDTVYEAMKQHPDPLEVSGEVERFRNEAANALAKYFAAVLHQEQGEHAGPGDPAERYEYLYNLRAPKAMVLITTSMGVVRDLANGNTNASLDAFLDGVMRGQA